MSIQVSTQDSTCYIRRSTSLSYNAAYTVLFRIYKTGTVTSTTMWTLSASIGSGGGTTEGSYYEHIRFNSGGQLVLENWVGGSGITIAGPASLSDGWHEIAAIRSSSSVVKLRVDGTDYTTSSLEASGRDASAYEIMLSRGSEYMAVGSRVTNYKAWSSALSNAEVDAEHDATAFTVTANKYSGSPMGDTGNLSNNLTADGSGTTWTAGAGVTFGANDPGVTYGGGSSVPIGLLRPRFINFQPGFSR
jgi:hypothetical protein